MLGLGYDLCAFIREEHRWICGDNQVYNIFTADYLYQPRLWENQETNKTVEQPCCWHWECK